jgi:hypothetical protein
MNGDTFHETHRGLDTGHSRVPHMGHPDCDSTHQSGDHHALSRHLTAGTSDILWGRGMVTERPTPPR